ncbi:hypothetical protein BG006_002620 [Podila minutissima]|uniref:Major facilitator superfamily (MFS) profile domain-containing protein n=1 Tax=Podila minutissima TaxID=64525 RepID=A0A9P5SSM3_9FUNG|nr:hypothetical protein BG006_002620 [Podila minutissima]
MASSNNNNIENYALSISRPVVDHSSSLSSSSSSNMTEKTQLDLDRNATLTEQPVLTSPIPTLTSELSALDNAPVSTSAFTRFRSSNHFLSFTIGLAVFVDLLCYGIIMPLTPFIVEKLGLKSTANGALIACYAVGLLVASPIAGIISDKLANRRLPMIVGLVALLLSMVLFMEAMDHFWVLLVSRFAAGLAGGTTITLGFALLSDTYPANRLGEEMGKILVGQSLGLMAGPPLGGLLQEHVGKKAPYVLCIVLIAIDLVARLLIIEPRSEKVKALRAHKKQQLKEQKDLAALSSAPAKPKISTMRLLMSSKRLITSLLVSFTQAFLVAAIEPVLPLYLAATFNMTETKIGLTFLAISLPTFISPVAGWFSDKYGGKYMSIAAITLCAIFVTVLGIPGIPLWTMILFLVGIGGTCATYITPVLGELSAVVRVTGDGDGFARAFALFNMFFSLGMVVGPLLGALIYQETSMLWTCVLIGVVTLLMLPMVFMYMGGKEQKLEDQARYLEDMEEQDRVLNQIRGGAAQVAQGQKIEVA